MWTSHSHCWLHSRLMCIAMETAFKCFSFLIIFSLHKLAFPSCNKNAQQNVSEKLSQNEGSFLNISYLLNVSENSVSTDKTHLYVYVCQNNIISPLCKFTRPKQSQDFIVKYDNASNDTLCVAERRYFISSMRTWEIKISQLLTRSITAIYLDIENTTLHTQTVLQIPIDVKFPSKVTNLTVDGQEVSSTHLINEGQEVNVCCSFNRGNPPAVFSLLDMNGMEIANKMDKNTMQTEDSEEHLKVSLSVRCQDDWPTVRCEGSGSERNRSVSFLVRCAPQFVDGPVTLVSSKFEKVTFRVKAHTTIFNNCSLTQKTFMPKVKCNLSGEPPNLVLTLHPEDSITQGIWKITLGNEIGSANTTVNITEHSMSETTTQNEESVSETTARSDESVGVLTTIVLSCGCVLLIAVIAIVVVRIKITTKEPQKEVTAGPTDERRQSNDTTEGATMIVNDMYGTTGGANIRNDVSQTFRPPNRDLSLPLTASRAPARPPRAQHVRARDDMSSAQSDSPYDHETYGQTYLTSADVCKNKKKQKKGGAEGIKGDIYASVSAVRKEKKNQAIKDRTTPVYETDNTTETAESMEKASRQRDANGLIYGDLVFTAVSSPKPVVQQEAKTEYATIAMTAVVPPRNHKK